MNESQLLLMNNVVEEKAMQVEDFRPFGNLRRAGLVTLKQGKPVLTLNGLLEWSQGRIKIGDLRFMTAAQAIKQIDNLQFLKVGEFETIWRDQAVEIDGHLLFDERWVLGLGKLDPFWTEKT